MRGLKINKQAQGRDYPLSTTPEPVGMQQERLKQEVESFKGSYLKLNEKRKDSTSTKQDAMKKAGEKLIKDSTKL